VLLGRYSLWALYDTLLAFGCLVWPFGWPRSVPQRLLLKAEARGAPCSAHVVRRFQVAA
jgi:hypothetical protein